VKSSFLSHIRKNSSLAQNVMVLVLWALLAQTLFPTLAAAFPKQDGNGYYTTTMCTSKGLVTLTLDAQGNRVDDTPAERSVERCPLCIFNHVAVAPIGDCVFTLASVQLVTRIAISIDVLDLTDGVKDAYLARAPPFII